MVTQFRNTIGLKGHLSTRLQPNHPTDDVLGISASILDGLMYGNGDAVIGINPATDNLHNLSELLKLLDHVIQNIKFQRNLVYLRISAQAFNWLKKCTD